MKLFVLATTILQVSVAGFAGDQTPGYPETCICDKNPSTMLFEEYCFIAGPEGIPEFPYWSGRHCGAKKGNANFPHSFAATKPYPKQIDVLAKKAEVVVLKDFTVKPMSRWTEITRDRVCKSGIHVSCSFGTDQVNGERHIRAGRGFIILGARAQLYSTDLLLGRSLIVSCSGYDPNGSHMPDPDGPALPGAQVAPALDDVICGLRGFILIRKAPVLAPRDY